MNHPEHNYSLPQRQPPKNGNDNIVPEEEKRTRTLPLKRRGVPVEVQELLKRCKKVEKERDVLQSKLSSAEIEGLELRILLNETTKKLEDFRESFDKSFEETKKLFQDWKNNLKLEKKNSEQMGIHLQNLENNLEAMSGAFEEREAEVSDQEEDQDGGDSDWVPPIIGISYSKAD